jgi:hypothetical protein
MGKFIKLLPFIFIVLLFACEEEEECIGCNLNPKIKLKFEALYSKPKIDSLFISVNNKISEYVDSLSGQLSNDERNALEEELGLLRKDSLQFDEPYNLFRIGKTKIDAIEALGAKDLEQLQDTIIRDFSIPVDMQSDTSTFYFAYHGFIDTLQISYQRDIIQTLDGVRMRISDIGVNKEISTFDSIRIKCYNVECSNDRTTIYVYF